MTTYENKRQKTRTNIIIATIELAQEQGLNTINITQIIQEADINRSTFYRYFEDKADLVQQIETKLLQEIEQQFKRKEDRIDFIIEFLNLIEQHASLIQMLLNRNGDIHFIEELVDLFLKLGKKRLQQVAEINIDTKYQDLFVHWSSFTMIALIRYWLNHRESFSKQDFLTFIDIISPTTN